MHLDKVLDKNTRYKRIEMESNILENSIISDINSAFSMEDIFLENYGGKLIINLRALDLEKFRQKINETVQKHKLPLQNPLVKAVKCIENIKSYGIKSGKRLYVGYDRERKVKNRKQKAKKRGMYYYAAKNNFSTANSKIPEEFENKVICADSEDFLKKLPDNCVDLIFTSPPYNFGLDYDNYKDGTNWNAYFVKLFRIFKECIRVLKFGGRIVVDVQPLFSDYIPIHHIISNFFMKNKMIWRAEILWEKHNYNAKYTAWGSWKSRI